ncbi:proline racemase family protein [Seohaeicola zhoushanensis]|uniref:Proline racemase n=1 Tax=Seohaeicola zhoushanensis TaxID=1569283 RepID=A0A8J3GYX9_9RHOB|nr:proline racemase family protein [Seohaeicola zhoushanensis]GHF56122.1 proline racemase [Seohaeicola zhoushanensis]
MTPITTIEMHTGGEPVRIITGGWPEVDGAGILDKRRFARDHQDHLRKLVIFEPRGHFDMYAALPVEPDLPGCDMGVLFLHNEGYSTMCGHAVIALGRFAVDHGIIPAVAPLTHLTIQCPCGPVAVEVEVAIHGDDVQSGAVRFTSVPSFAPVLDAQVEVEGFGRVTLDIGYGGAFYAILPAQALGLTLDAPLRDLVEAATRVTEATAKAIPLSHPDDPDLAFLYGTILTDGIAPGPERASRNICVFAAREVDRSPTGSGVSARMAIATARGLRPGTLCRFESVTGAVFTGETMEETVAGAHRAWTVRVGGRAYYTGSAEFLLEEGDELGRGFLL